MYDNLKERIKKYADLTKFSTEENSFIARWKENYGMKDDIIIEAVKRTIERKKMLVFNYADAILRNWSVNNVKSYQDIIKLDKEYQSNPKKKKEAPKETQEKAPEKELVKVRIQMTSPSAKVPTYGSDGAAGADLYADIDYNLFIPSGETVFVGTGVAMEIPDGYVGLVFARSGIACKRGLGLANAVAVIDSDYRGEIKVALKNYDNYNASETTKEDYINKHTITPGERIAQIVIVPFLGADFTISPTLSDTARGINGFGSTGNL